MDVHLASVVMYFTIVLFGLVILDSKIPNIKYDIEQFSKTSDIAILMVNVDYVHAKHSVRIIRIRDLLLLIF